MTMPMAVPPKPHAHAHKKLEPTPAQKQQLREAFDLFDEEQTNHLDYHALKCVLRALGFDVKKKDVLQMMEEHDPEGRGVISYSEFVSIAAPRICARDPEEELVRAFELIDSDGTGFISLRNLRMVTKELGDHRSDEELQAMIGEFDTDGDGEISLVEFGAILGIEITGKYGSRVVLGARERATTQAIAAATKRIEGIATNQLKGAGGQRSPDRPGSPERAGSPALSAQSGHSLKQGSMW